MQISKLLSLQHFLQQSAQISLDVTIRGVFLKDQGADIREQIRG